MAYSSQTIHDMFDALQKRIGSFPKFEDVPASVLDAEKAAANFRKSHGKQRLSSPPDCRVKPWE
jgi:hypothetical protein